MLRTEADRQALQGHAWRIDQGRGSFGGIA